MTLKINGTIPALTLVATCLVLCAATSTLADEIKYEIAGYGGDRALLILTGKDSKSLTPSMNGTGTSARISGVQVTFRPANAAPLPTLISSVQQVKRGALTDLVINLSAATDLGITPGAADTRIYFKRKGSLDPVAASTPSQAASKAITEKLSQVPLQLTTSSNNPGQSGSLTINLPDLSVLKVNTIVARQFITAAYVSDLIGSWILGIPVTFSTSSDANIDKDRANLEKLVKDLTAEVTSLREQLAAHQESAQQTGQSSTAEIKEQ
jgi:hypothetical protein